MKITKSDVESLVDKLERMDLTDGERLALDAVFRAAAGDEVAGYATTAYTDAGRVTYLSAFEAMVGGRAKFEAGGAGLYEEISFKP